ncbi:MAG: hypothetical protein K2H04_08310 [Bacteroidaceae bacterium]|nr:hypothetical protein [Bacteroidaceae bacterium]
MSTCIFVKGCANRGKSNAICKLAHLLNVPPTAWQKEGKEVDVILNKYGKMIGLHSEGDPGCNSIDWIKDAISQKGCDIVIVACRTGGSTQDPAISFLNQRGDEYMEISPVRKPNACYSDSEIDLFSTSTALSLLHLIANL